MMRQDPRYYVCASCLVIHRPVADEDIGMESFTVDIDDVGLSNVDVVN
jgi:hypothetical protein